MKKEHKWTIVLICSFFLSWTIWNVRIPYHRKILSDTIEGSFRCEENPRIYTGTRDAKLIVFIFETGEVLGVYDYTVESDHNYLISKNNMGAQMIICKKFSFEITLNGETYTFNKVNESSVFIDPLIYPDENELWQLG